MELINQASLYGKDSVRVQHLRHVQELILRKDPSLLDNFLEVIAEDFENHRFYPLYLFRKYSVFKLTKVLKLEKQLYLSLKKLG